MRKVVKHVINEAISLPSNDPRFEHSNGKIYTDKDYVCAGCCVTGLKVVIGDGMVSGIQFIYDDNMENDNCYGASTGKVHITKFAEEEYIKEFSWISGFNNYYANKTGGFTWNIQVVTNRETYVYGEEPLNFFCGAKKRYMIKASDKHQLVGICCKARCSDLDAQPTDKSGTNNQILNVLYTISHLYEVEVDNGFLKNSTYFDDYSYVVNANALTSIKGSILKGGINQLQFVYDDGETTTSMRGQSIGGDEIFEIQLSGRTIRKFVYRTACSNDENSILYKIEVELSDGSILGAGSDSLPKGLKAEHVYTLKAEDGYEIWAFAGVYHQYIGGFTQVYKRYKNHSRIELDTSSKIENSTNAKTLFINVVGVGNQGTTVDPNARLLNKYFREWRGKNKGKLGEYDCLPANSDKSQKLCNVDKKDVEAYILSGQYEYIVFHCHGNNFSVGNSYPLINVEWVLNNKEQIGKSCANTVFHFNCCECGYRNKGEIWRKRENKTYEKKEVDGLAVSLVECGAKAAFGYTVGLSIPNVAEVEVKSYLVDFLGAVHHVMLIDNCNINDASKAIIKRFEAILEEIAKLAKNENVEKYIGEIHKEYQTLLSDEKFVESTEDFVSIRYNIYVESIKQLSGVARRICLTYWQLYYAKAHFCGPGGDSSTDLKSKNMGEACRDYGYVDKLL